MMVLLKMRDSVPSPRYSLVCNVLRQWKTLLIPTYRVYRLYDIKDRKNIFKMNKEVRMLLPKKDLIQVEQGKLIIIMRISIYLLITTLTSHTYTLYPYP